MQCNVLFPLGAYHKLSNANGEHIWPPSIPFLAPLLPNPYSLTAWCNTQWNPSLLCVKLFMDSPLLNYEWVEFKSRLFHCVYSNKMTIWERQSFQKERLCRVMWGCLFTTRSLTKIISDSKVFYIVPSCRSVSPNLFNSEEPFLSQ